MSILTIPIKFRSKKYSANTKIFNKLKYIKAVFIYNKYTFNIYLKKEQVDFLYKKNLFFKLKIFKIKFLNKNILVKVFDLKISAITNSIIHVSFINIPSPDKQMTFCIPICFESFDSKFREYTNILKNNLILKSNLYNLPNKLKLNVSNFKVNKTIKVNDLLCLDKGLNLSTKQFNTITLISYFYKK
ncbi:hypothetical protein E5P55_00545 [Candidatus Pinguicoccus supinus]|uniref:50S ribosomal protein L25 n=1 Tax=Candidatus Pinguicoccus supinus TaxID=2529394 RepID=A0A7T0FYA5_9BACT|nr:hypothetical protein E5P55_00545 [Candidatus Pinguicoccus supinus]